LSCHIKIVTETNAYYMIVPEGPQYIACGYFLLISLLPHASYAKGEQADAGLVLPYGGGKAILGENKSFSEVQ